MADLQRTLLQALGYPRPDAFDAADGAALRALVAWLENTKVRHYPEAARAGLNATRDAAAWGRAFAQYLEDLGCPAAAASSSGGGGGGSGGGSGGDGDGGGGGSGGGVAPAALQWLLAHAVALEYEDAADDFNAAAAAAGRGEAGGGAAAGAYAAVTAAARTDERRRPGGGGAGGGRGTKRAAPGPAQRAAQEAEAFADCERAFWVSEGHCSPRDVPQTAAYPSILPSAYLLPLPHAQPNPTQPYRSQ